MTSLAKPRLHSSLIWMPASNSFWSVRKFLLFTHFSSWVQGHCPSPNITLSILHVAPPAFQELAEQTISLSVAHRVSDTKISGAMTFRPFVYCEFYDGWLRTACNWGLGVVVLNKQMNLKCSATPLNKNLSLPNFGNVPASIWRQWGKLQKNLSICLLWVDDSYFLKIQALRYAERLVPPWQTTSIIFHSVLNSIGLKWHWKEYSGGVFWPHDNEPWVST